MKLHSYIDAFFIQSKSNNNKKEFSLEVGKTYKATLLFSKGNFSFFSINGLIFKANFINTSSKFIYLKVLENKDNYKFELIKENIYFEKTENFNKDLLNNLKEKLSEDIYKKLVENSSNIETNGNIKEIISSLQNLNYIFHDSKYQALLKIDEDKYLHIECYEDEPSCFSFSLSFEIEKGKYLVVKGYYKKNENKVNCNFITNSKSFYEKLSFANKELEEINSNFHWVCNQRFTETLLQ